MAVLTWKVLDRAIRGHKENKGKIRTYSFPTTKQLFLENVALGE